MMTEPSGQATVSAQTGMDRRLAPHASSWRRWRAPVLLLACAIGAALLIRVLPARGSTDIALANVEIGTVRRASFDDYLPVRALVAPGVTTLVGVLAGGQVERLLVQDGTMVMAGQPLATLANPELRLDVLTREAQIASQLGSVAGEDLGIERNRLDRSGQIAQANYDLIKAKRELLVRQQLHDKGFVSDAGMKSYADEVAYQQKRLAQLRAGGAAEASITAMQAARLADARNRLESNLKAVRAGLDALVIRAPASGRLTNFTIQPGQTLRPGDPAGQVDSEGSWKLIADIDEYYLGRLTVGQKGSVGDVSLTVTRILPAVKDGRFRIELGFDGRPPAGLNRGQTLDARITFGARANTMVAPTGAWLESGNANSAFVLHPDGAHARRRAIRVGRHNPDQAEILSGLAPGDRIVTSDTSSVKGDIINLR
jgi:HlyD family secretion protein